jgi:hypothetical protein
MIKRILLACVAGVVISAILLTSGKFGGFDLGSTTGLIVGIIGTSIAIYQWAIINESKKNRENNQFLIASIGQYSLSKFQGWQNQINIVCSRKDRELSEHELEICKLMYKFKDECMELQALAGALERAIDADGSATMKLMEQTLTASKLNNDIQEEGLKNPTNQFNQGNNESPKI